MAPATQRFLADAAQFITELRAAIDQTQKFSRELVENAHELKAQRDAAIEAAGADAAYAREADKAARASRGIRENTDVAAAGLSLLKLGLAAIAPAAVPAFAAVAVGAGSLAGPLAGAALGLFGLLKMASTAKAPIKDLHDHWAALEKSLHPQVVSAVTSVVKALNVAMTLLKPIIKPVAAAVTDLGNEARKALGSPYWQNFAHLIGKLGGEATRTFGRVLGDVAKGLAGLVKDFAPVASKVLPGIEQLAEKFAKWGNSAKAAKDVQDLIGYVKQHGPQMVKVVKELAEDIPKVVKALAGMGGGALTGIQVILEVIGKLTPGQLQDIATAILLIAAATKVWAIAQGILDIALDANPIGLIVIAIAALILAIIEVVKHWKTIAKVAKEVWKASVAAWHSMVSNIKTAAERIWNSIKAAWDKAKSATLSAWNRIKNAVKSAWDHVVNAVKSGVSHVVSFVRSLPGKIVAALAGLVGKLYKAGVNAMHGLLNGLKASAPSAISFAKHVASSISLAFSGVLGIFSPSRVFAAHGRNIVAGLVQGITGAQHLAVRAVQGLGGAMTPGGGGMAIGGGTLAALSGPAGGGGSVYAPTVHVHVAGSVLSEKELQGVVQTQVLKYARRNPTNGLNLFGGGRATAQ